MKLTNHRDVMSNAYDMAAVLRKCGYTPEVRAYGDCDVEVLAWSGIDNYEDATENTPCVVFNAATMIVKNAKDVEVVA